MRFDAGAALREILSQEEPPATSATLLLPSENNDLEEKTSATRLLLSATLPEVAATKAPESPREAPKSGAPSIPKRPEPFNPVHGLWGRLEGDMEAYAEALRRHGPMSYGMAMGVLGWGGTRAGQAESDLRAVGRITFNALGRAVLVDQECSSDE